MKALLLTGRPGIGKTTVIRRVADALKGERVGGFYTEELRSGSERKSFRIVTLDGRSRQMASIDMASPHRVGKYGVDVSAVEAVAEEALAPRGAEVFLVDEIGKWNVFRPRSSRQCGGCSRPSDRSWRPWRARERA